jgi:hypothetical protein
MDGLTAILYSVAILILGVLVLGFMGAFLPKEKQQYILKVLPIFGAIIMPFRGIGAAIKEFTKRLKSKKGGKK